MDSRKLEFADDVVHEIDGLCKLIFNVESPDHISKILGISHDQMEVVIQQMSLGLPEQVFEVTASKLKEELEHLCAQEFIFFQVQESKGDPAYQENLQRFIRFLSGDILHRIDAYYQKTSIKEEKK